MSAPVSVAWVNLTNGGMSGGFRKYNDNVLPRLAADPRFGRISVHSPGDMQNVHVPAGCDEFRWPTKEYLYGLPTLRRQLRERRPDVVYIPMHRWVDTGEIPLVVMYRNMEAAKQPWGENGIAEGIRNLLRQYDGKRAVRRATGVIAVSRFVADSLAGDWGIDPAKMRMIYHGVAEDRAEPRRPASVPDDGVPFFFTAGSIRPFRGLQDIVEAIPMLPEQLRGYRVVVGGRLEGRVSGYHAGLRKRAAKLGIEDRIIWAGMLGTSEMSWGFRNCTAFLMTSRVEACPNTALEAMHAGAACIATTNRPMPEFFADAAEYFTAGDAAGLARAMAQLANDGARRERLQRDARARMAEFTWQRTYEQTAAFLLDVARGSSRALARAG